MLAGNIEQQHQRDTRQTFAQGDKNPTLLCASLAATFICHQLNNGGKKTKSKKQKTKKKVNTTRPAWRIQTSILSSAHAASADARLCQIEAPSFSWKHARSPKPTDAEEKTRFNEYAREGVKQNNNRRC